jgi:ribosomal protein L37AE/L43A
MNQKKNDDKLEQVPRVRYVGFWCPKCNRNWMIWHRRKESAMQAHVYEFTIIEGNTYPEISGFYKEAPEVKELDEDFETGTWTCLECGYVLTDYEGTPLKSVEEVIKYLTIKYDDLGLDGLFAGMDQVLDFLFVDEA